MGSSELVPSHVGEAFGVSGTPSALPSSGEPVVLVGNVVVKRVDDVAVSSFCQAMVAACGGKGPRQPRPIEARDGSWSVDGWIASEFVPSLQRAPSDTGWLIQVGLELVTAMADVGVAKNDAVVGRTDRWAIADRFAWGEVELELQPTSQDLVGRLRSRIDDTTGAQQLIHADLMNNVFVDGDDAAVVLDLSPLYRPVDHQSGIIAADVLLWGDASAPQSGQIVNDASLARGLLFRFVAAELGDDAVDVDRCAAVVDQLGW